MRRTSYSEQYVAVSPADRWTLKMKKLAVSFFALFMKRSRAAGRKTGALEAFHLGDLVIVHDNVDLTIMKALDLALDEVEPGGNGGG